MGHGVSFKVVVVEIFSVESDVSVDYEIFRSKKWSTVLSAPSVASTHPLTGYTTRGRLSFYRPDGNYAVTGSA